MTTAAPPGWHPDPTGRHELRYWDGVNWSVHVSDRGVTGQDPLEFGPAIRGTVADLDASQDAGAPEVVADDVEGLDFDLGGPGDGPLFTTTLGASFGRKKELVVDHESLVWDGKRIPYGDVTTVAYLATKQSVNGVPTGTIYSATFELRDGAKVKITFQAGSIGRRETKDETARAFQAIVGAIASFIEPRLRVEMVQHMQAGGSVEIGGVRMGRGGLAFKPKMRSERTAEWTAVLGAVMSRGYVFVFMSGSGSTDKREELARMAMSVPNAVILPGLLQEGVGVFGAT